MPKLNIPCHRWKNHPASGTDFPEATPVATDGELSAAVVDALARQMPGDIELMAGIDMGGFGFAGALAYRGKIGFLHVRKVSNVNHELMRTLASNYVIANGLAISRANRLKGRKVAVVDDCLMSGSTALAAINLLRKLGAECSTALFIYALDGMDGAKRLETEGVAVSVLRYLPRSQADDPVAPITL